MATISDNMRGAFLMMVSMAAFTLNDACMKSLSDEMPLFQALFLRGVAVIVLLLVLARAMGALRFDISRRDWGYIALRTVGETGAAYFVTTALFNAPIANITAIMQSLPLTVTLASALFLGEVVGWRRLSAILVGFLGVLLIAQPGTEGFNFYTVYALIAVVFVTLRDIATRQLSAEVPSLVVALCAAVGVTVFAAIMSFSEPWAAISAKAGMQVGGAVVFVIGGYLFSVMTMRVGEIGFIAPFRYTSLVVALILGFVVFGEWPQTLTLLGALIVVATGIFTFYGERRHARRGPVPLRVR